MLDGRQVAVLARHVAGDHDAALYLLDNTATPEPWEKAVATFLRALCVTAAEQPVEAPLTAVADGFLNLGPTPGHPIFRIRLGLCVLALAPASKAPHLAARITRDALTSMDAYAAAGRANASTVLLEHVRSRQDHAHRDRAGVRPEPRHDARRTPRRTHGRSAQQRNTVA
jgi:hypothetical protein